MANEIKCPKCGEVFTVDEASYAAILRDVRNSEFDKDVKARESELKKSFDLEKKLFEEQLKNDNEKSLKKYQDEIKSLKASIDLEKEKVASSFKDKLSEEEKKNIELKKDLESFKATSKAENTEAVLNKQKELDVLKQRFDDAKEIYEAKLKDKDTEIEYYKDLKARLNSKMLGESLEVHCSNEFNKLRPLFLANGHKVYFEKDNDDKEGTKGDFIYRETTADGVELISIMFEMKNQAEDTTRKHKNDEFFEKLDKDRIKKKCEYAVLVSLLEIDNELYNTGIVDVSYEYPKMYVIRPQFFIPVISFLRNAALNALEYKNELETLKNQNFDITKFEERVEEFKDKFGKNCDLATKKFYAAIDDIDKSIAALQKVKEELQGCSKNLRIAVDKADDLSVKKLVKDLPTLKEKLEQADETKLLENKEE